jgi:hypothetical protein
MITHEYWDADEGKVKTLASKEHSEAVVVRLTMNDPMFDGEYISLVDHKTSLAQQDGTLRVMLARSRRLNKWLFFTACLAIGLASTLSYHIGLRDGRKQAPSEYITVTEPQKHTVLTYQAVEVAKASCPTEESCELRWQDRDGDGEGQAEVVEVVP